MDKDKKIKTQRIAIIILAVLLIASIIALVITVMNSSKTKEEDNKSKEEQQVQSTELIGLPEYKVSRVANFLEYEGTNGIKFSYPFDWISAGTDESPLFIKNDENAISVNVLNTEYPTGLDFNYYLSQTKENLLATIQVEGDPTQEIINLNGRKACRIDYVASQDDSRLRVTQVVLVVDDQVYILTTTVVADKYEEVKSDLENIIKSFRKE